MGLGRVEMKQDFVFLPRISRITRIWTVFIDKIRGSNLAWTNTLPTSIALWLSLATGGISFVIYLLTMATDLTWANFGADGGELITAAVTLGIPHPPGYPTYVVLGKLFSYLPMGTVAFRFHLLSALAIATAVAFITATTYAWTGKHNWSRYTAVGAGLIFAFAPIVWGQALIAEVYALNLAMLALFIWALWTKQASWLTGLFFGLSITTHLTSLLMLPLALALTPRNKWTQLLGGMLLGLTPFLLLPLLAAGNSPVMWGNANTLAGWLWLVSGSLYQANLQLPSITELPNQLVLWGQTIGRQFMWVGWLLLIPAIHYAKIDAKRTGWLLATAVLYAIYSLIYQTEDALLYFLPGFMLLTILLGWGLKPFGRWALILPIVLLVINFSATTLRQQHISPNKIAAAALADMPTDAIVLTPGDRSIFTLWYTQHIEKQRPDLILVDANLMAFAWYREQLGNQYQTLQGLDKDDLNQFQKLNGVKRPFCTLTLLEPTKIHCTEAKS